MPKAVPVLTYHSHKVLGNSYETNDHIALCRDLRTIQEQGFQIVPLTWVVEWILGRQKDSLSPRSVAISFDDGADFDYYDLEHPQYGWQRGFYNILRDFQNEVGSSAQPYLHASSFVIVSPEARQDIGTHVGKNWMTDGWWKEASQSKLLSIQNHSWDHNHPEAKVVCEKNQQKGSFLSIDTYAECQAEVKQAAEYIYKKTSTWPSLFAYPCGEASSYLRETYFPSFQDQHGTVAAFGASGGYVTQLSSRWDLPRFMSSAPWPGGWRNTNELVQILQSAQ